ncbi:MAG: DUF222 domain-containing protein [Gordonia sp. (in: high G+C Gram-positive bacteria)]|uniref:DUF222 domain-containing protein n=1 Tax=Gordonia sp. (in: high G+C Gram-positive bacteria) TaxID=84139 RepID=UPI003BB756C4
MTGSPVHGDGDRYVSLDNATAHKDGAPTEHAFIAIGGPDAAPISETELAARVGTVLPDDALGLLRVIDTAAAKLATTNLAQASEAELTHSVEVSERIRRRFDGLSANLYLEGSDRSIHRAAGFLTMPAYLALGHRLGRGETKRRSALALRLTRRTALTGDTLEPTLPATADAVAGGQIGAAHALVIAGIMKKVPGAIDPADHTTIESELAQHARSLSPTDLEKAGARLLALIDPDGAYTEPQDRQRQRAFSISAQDDQLMSKLAGKVTPALKEKLAVIFTKLAAPGVNNPADPNSPRSADRTADQTLDDDALTAARTLDDRTADQRGHDALEAIVDFFLANKGLGRPDRIPAEIVISVSDADLARHAGVGIGAAGTLIPVADLIELAADATPHLAVFRHHTREALYLGRGKKNRFANKAQRLMLFARDGGCTASACDAPFVRTEAHHSPDWAPSGPMPQGGRTDIDAIGSCCGGHNRWVGPKIGQWETLVLTSGPNAGRMAWRPTGTRGPWALNPTHHPELLSQQGAHAPPDDRSGFEKRLEARLGFAFLTPDPARGTTSHTAA